MTRKLLFESKTCSRCGGSGKFSWCQMHGDTCFGCGGGGQQLTKKGRAAQVWLNAKKRKRLGEVAVGDWVLSEGIAGFSVSFWVKIDQIEGAGAELKATGLNKRGERHGWQGDMEVQIFQGKAKAAELAKEALAFQETLTKTGTVRKVKAKKEKADVVEA